MAVGDMALFRDASGVTHYVHIVPVAHGSNQHFFHCSPSLRAQSHFRAIRHDDEFRDDVVMTCLWCACDMRQ